MGAPSEEPQEVSAGTIAPSRHDPDEDRRGDREQTFLCDMMLGRLARWLRIIGYDTLYPRGLDDPELAARAAAEGRVLLTRDKLLSETDVCRTYYIESDALKKQLAAVIGRFDLVCDPNRLDSRRYRCSRCNAPLEERAKATVEGKVPKKVFEYQYEFWYCGRCDQYYWQGTHWDNIIDTARRVRNELEESREPKQ